MKNNSLSGDYARESVKPIARNMKVKVRDKLGDGAISSIVNSIISATADSVDALLGAADYGAMALTACAMRDNYCTQELSDLSGKNQAVADILKALMKSDTWSAMAGTVKQAYQGKGAPRRRRCRAVAWSFGTKPISSRT